MRIDERIEALHVNNSSVSALHVNSVEDAGKFNELHATAIKDGEHIRAFVRIAEITTIDSKTSEEDRTPVSGEGTQHSVAEFS